MDLNKLLGGTWELYSQGKVMVGVDPTQTEFSTVGKTGGEKSHKLITSEMPEHTHVQNSHNHAASSTSAGSHSHTASSSTTGDHNHNVVVAHPSGDGSVNYGGGGYFAVQGPSGQYRPIGVLNKGASLSGKHTHTVTVTTGGGHSHTVTVVGTTATNKVAGGNLAHNNLQPYVTVYYYRKTLY